MDAVEDSFVEYVGARWAMLYRQAVLLAGERDAEAVTQAALVRAYFSWDQVRDAASPDASVREFLVDAAVRAARRERRTVPLLDDLQAMASEPMPGQVPDVPVPEPPLDRIAAGIREARRRSVRRALAVTAALAAVIALVVLTTDSDDRPGTRPVPPSPSTPSTTRSLPFSVDELPHGPPSRVAVVAHGMLLLGSRSYRLDGDACCITQAGPLVTLGYRDGRGVLFRTDLPDFTPEVVTDSAEGPLLISPDGGYLAYQRRVAGDAVVLVVHPLDGSPELVRPVPAKACCGSAFTVDGITRHGIVASLPARHRVWFWSIDADRSGGYADGGLREVSGLEGFGSPTVAQVTADRIVLAGNIRLAVGTVRADGRFVESGCCRAVRGLRTGSFDLRDPAGERVAFVRDGALWIRDLEAATDLTLPLPGAEEGPVVRWEDEERVLVLLELSAANAPGGTGGPVRRTVLMRCAPETRHCERAEDLLGVVQLAR